MMLAAMLVVLLIFTLLGMEIAWAIALSCFAYIALSQLTDNPTAFALFAQQMTVGLDSFVLVSVPLFIFAGELMNVCGVTQRLVRVAAVIVGHMHGGLANVGVVANFLMSGISGSSVADAAATGTVLVPEMKRRRFPGEFACAVIACAATVGPIIPPSIVFLLLASIVNVSVGQLFLAGVVPGVLMSLFMFLVTWWLCKKRNYPREERATPREVRIALADGVLALIAPAVIVGSIVAGIATPTESAAIAVGYTLFLGLVVLLARGLVRPIRQVTAALVEIGGGGGDRERKGGEQGQETRTHRAGTFHLGRHRMGEGRQGDLPSQGGMP